MLFILCILSTMLFSFIADKFESKICVFLCTLILSIFCGLRGIGTGVDTIHYFRFLSYIRTIGIKFGSDIGFSTISYFLMGYFENPFYPLFIYSAITIFLIVYRLWDFRKEASFPLMILIFIAFYYSYVFNIVRQFLAISIIFWATKYIERGQYWKYVVANTLAASIHTSSLMCFSYLFIKFGNKAENKKNRLLLFMVAAIFIIIGIYFLSKNATKYLVYFIAPETRLHSMTIFKILCWFMVIFLSNVFKNNEFSITKSGEIVPMQKQIPLMYASGLLLAAFGMMFTYMNRIGLYFIMYEMPFWGQSARARVNKNIYRTVIFLIIGYIFATNYLAGQSADNLFFYQSFLSQQMNY